MNQSDNSHIAFRKKFAYALPAFSLAVVGIPVYVYIPKFYTDVVGINLPMLGILLFSVRIFDALTDPVMGFISDKIRTPFGRRRPFIAIGSIVLTLAMYQLFNPPHTNPAYETVWFGVWIYLLFLFWTVVTVPYESLGPEITFDYHQRTSLFGMRDGFLIAGTLMAASLPAIVQLTLSLDGTAAAERSKFFWISVIYAPLVIGSCLWCVAVIKEQPQTMKQPKVKFARGLRTVLQNRPFIVLLAAYTISAIGNNLPATLILYYVEYVLNSKLADLFLLLYFVTGIVFLPGWIRLSQKIGKKKSWLGAMAINSGAFIGVFFLGPGDAWIYGILVFLSGIGFGATLALPSAIQADVIDYDELISGQRREGQYIGLWSISKKLAAAAGIGIGLAVLGMSGYQPNVEQTESVKLTLRSLYALVPSLCNIAGFLIALAYPISSEVHASIRSRIAKRNEGEKVWDPLNPQVEIALK